jgi:molybdate transport system substrate-binding protein
MRTSLQDPGGTTRFVVGWLLAIAATCAGALPVVAQASAPVEPVELTLYAASSLRDVLRELEPLAERATGTRLVFNLGASNDLARQILAANKADLFFSADESWMDRVAEAGLVDTGSRRAPLANRLVVVVPAASTLSIAGARDLGQPAIRRLALADPIAVPAGRYAKAWLESQRAWSAVADRVIPALDVRAALAAVESGAVDAGIVYRTDAAQSRRVRVACAVPEAESPRIVYALAALAQRPHLAEARAVAAWLAGPAAAVLFERAGFITVAGDPGR